MKDFILPIIVLIITGFFTWNSLYYKNLKKEEKLHTHATPEQSINDYFTHLNNDYNTYKYTIVDIKNDGCTNVYNYIDSLVNVIKKDSENYNEEFNDNVLIRKTENENYIKRLNIIKENIDNIDFNIYKVIFIEESNSVTNVDSEYYFINNNNNIFGKKYSFREGYFCINEREFYKNENKFTYMYR